MGKSSDTTSGGTEGKTGKSFEELFAVLKQRKRERPVDSKTVEELDKGIPFIAFRIFQEADEVWKACKNNETREQLALEISQVIYHLQVMMVAHDLELEDIYRVL